MFKQIVTLFRGHAHSAGEAILHRNALTVLDQQLRDVGAAIHALRKALAFAIADERQEAQRLDGISARITGLEQRICAALAAGDETLADIAAATVAELEMDRDAGRQAQRLIAAEIMRLRRILRDAERRFAELQRGRRLARVTDDATRAGLASIDTGLLRNAEATLAALRDRQTAQTIADETMIELTATPGQIEDRLAAAGFGPSPRPTAAGVLARLRPLAITQA